MIGEPPAQAAYRRGARTDSPVSSTVARCPLPAAARPIAIRSRMVVASGWLTAIRLRMAAAPGVYCRIEHGEFAVRIKAGERGVDGQRGVVTAVNGQSLTVKLADGFNGTYTGPLA